MKLMYRDAYQGRIQRGSTVVYAREERAQNLWPRPKPDKPRLLIGRDRRVLDYFLAVKCSIRQNFELMAEFGIFYERKVENTIKR